MGKCAFNRQHKSGFGSDALDQECEEKYLSHAVKHRHDGFDFLYNDRAMAPWSQKDLHQTISAELKTRSPKTVPNKKN